MSQERSKELEKIKWRVLSHMIESSVLPPAEALRGVPGQKAIAALETFLHEAFRLIREEVLLRYLLPKSLDPEIIHKERELLQPRASQIGVVTVGSEKSKAISSSKQADLVPIIHLSGSHLERCGFCIGQRLTVSAGTNELILKADVGYHKGLDQSSGGGTNG
jgi:hypothetical protein